MSFVFDGKKLPTSDAPVVYVVDDDGGVRCALGALIATLGWRVELFASGDEFLRSPHSEQGCLLLDLHMPGTNGADVLDTLRQTGQEMPVVLMTAHPKSSQMDRVRELGVHRFLYKPFDDADLDLELRMALENWPRSLD